MGDELLYWFLDATIDIAPQVIETLEDIWNEFESLFEDLPSLEDENDNPAIQSIWDAGDLPGEVQWAKFLEFLATRAASSDLNPQVFHLLNTTLTLIRATGIELGEAITIVLRQSHASAVALAQHILSVNQFQKYCVLSALIVKAQIQTMGYETYTTIAENPVLITTGSAQLIAGISVRLDSIGTSPATLLDGIVNMANGGDALQQGYMNQMINKWKYYRLKNCTLKWFPSNTFYPANIDNLNANWVPSSRMKMMMYEDKTKNSHDFTFARIKHEQHRPGTTVGFHDSAMVHSFNLPVRGLFKEFTQQTTSGNGQQEVKDMDSVWFPTKDYTGNTPTQWATSIQQYMSGYMTMWDPAGRVVPASTTYYLGMTELHCTWEFNTLDNDQWNLPGPAQNDTTNTAPIVQPPWGPGPPFLTALDMEEVMDTQLQEQDKLAQQDHHPITPPPPTPNLLVPPVLNRSPAIAGTALDTSGSLASKGELALGSKRHRVSGTS
uniref:Uncharacterized protein n=1 Tax=Luscinia sibilans CRESS-DNA-virus sp. TaxID=2815041 RepID=A0A8A4XBK7_9VIRU|nr:MAG: hypothetical protein [Luscinia sibilans CRESS-DNA-virus sp.]